MNDQTKIGHMTAAQIAADQAAAAQTEAAAIDKDPAHSERDYWRDIVLGLDDLLRANGRIELVSNSDSSVDVRCNGVAAYGGSLRTAIATRLSLEAARVTDKLMGTGAGAARNLNYNPADHHVKKYP